jgi:hypothetical protein
MATMMVTFICIMLDEPRVSFRRWIRFFPICWLLDESQLPSDDKADDDGDLRMYAG